MEPARFALDAQLEWHSFRVFIGLGFLADVADDTADDVTGVVNVHARSAPYMGLSCWGFWNSCVVPSLKGKLQAYESQKGGKKQVRETNKSGQEFLQRYDGSLALMWRESSIWTCLKQF